MDPNLLSTFGRLESYESDNLPIQCIPKMQGTPSCAYLFSIESRCPSLMACHYVSVTIIVIFAVVIFVNILALVARVTTKQMRSIHFQFIILALMDLIKAGRAITLAATAIYYGKGYLLIDREWRSSWVCYVIGYLDVTCEILTRLLYTTVSRARYLAVANVFEAILRS